MKLQVLRPWIPPAFDVLNWALIGQLSGKEEDKRDTNSPDVIIHYGLKLLGVVHGGLLAKRDRRPALLSGRQRQRPGSGFFGGCGRITSKPLQIPAAVELDELKELYKKTKKNIDFET